MPPFFLGFLPYGENRSLLQTVSSGRYSFFASKTEAVMRQAALSVFRCIHTQTAGVDDEFQTCFCGTLEPAKIIYRHSARIVFERAAFLPFL